MPRSVRLFDVIYRPVWNFFLHFLFGIEIYLYCLYSFLFLQKKSPWFLGIQCCYITFQYTLSTAACISSSAGLPICLADHRQRSSALLVRNRSAGDLVVWIWFLRCYETIHVVHGYLGIVWTRLPYVVGHKFVPNIFLAMFSILKNNFS